MRIVLSNENLCWGGFQLREDCWTPELGDVPVDDRTGTAAFTTGPLGSLRNSHL